MYLFNKILNIRIIITCFLRSLKAARKSLDSDHGDPLTLLNAYTAWLEEKANDSSRTKKWCKRRGFEEQRFYEMTKLRQQFKALLKVIYNINVSF